MFIINPVPYISVIPADPQTLRSDKERQVNSFVIIMNSNRVYLFIDGGYVDHMQCHGFSGLLDFRKFIQYVTADYGELSHGWYYTCMPYLSPTPSIEERNKYARQQKLVSHVNNLPNMEVKLGKLQKRKNHFVQKRVDVLFALDVAKSAWNNKMDTAILFAGDSDFVPAVEDANNYGVKTVLYYYHPSFNYDLVHTVSESHVITPDIYQLISKSDTSQKSSQ